jgi:3-deoxy-manno-octulosonate cytidylyltransferase (CMP-KDO synthetase)
MKFLGIIPARYGSTRLDGKPLLDIMGKPMIQHVYEKASQGLDEVYVATDDRRVYDAVISFGGKVVMTSGQHQTGTNRCLEASQIIEKATNIHFDVIINIQGDEPLLDPRQLNVLMNCFTDEYIMMATLVTPVKDPADLNNESEAFVVFDKHFNALYFSRSVIPFIKGLPKESWHKKHTFYKHIGIYGYTSEALEIFANLPPTSLETSEGLEQNRWIENGYAIKVGITEYTSICVDTKEDLDKIRSIFNEKNKV